MHNKAFASQSCTARSLREVHTSRDLAPEYVLRIEVERSKGFAVGDARA